MATSVSLVNDSKNPLGPGTDRLPIKSLQQNDFLKLLAAQMTSQDPLNPSSDAEFMSQMTQFSTLEQAKSTQAEISQLRANQDFLRADGLLGRTVHLQALIDGETVHTTGIVDAIKNQAGTPQLIVNGMAFNLGEVVQVAPTMLVP